MQKNLLKISLILTLLIPSLSTAKDLEIIAGIYGWVPSVYGELKFTPSNDDSQEESVSPKTYSLNGLFMGNIEVRKDKFVFYTDIVYVDISQNGERKALRKSRKDYTLTISGWQSSYLAGYNLVKSENFSLDILAGIRYFSLELILDYTGLTGAQRTISPYKGLLDGIISTRGIYRLNKEWFIPFHLDAGAGNSRLTYQAVTGIGYGASWGDITLNYKHISWDQDDNKIINNITLTGTTLGYAYHF